MPLELRTMLVTEPKFPAHPMRIPARAHAHDAVPAQRGLAALLLAATIVACSGESASGGGGSGGSGATPKLTITEAHRTEAKGLFETLCVSCHGATGAGDGPAAAAMDPKPRAFGDPSWQSSVTDDHIRKVITLGGAAVGKSAAMVAQPQLKSKPEVLEAIVQVVRGFGKK